jgi:threonine synthase
MRYYSTNRQVPTVTLDRALLQGQAGDKGLFLPDRVPTIDLDALVRLKGAPYSELARFVLTPFTHGIIDDDRMRALCEDAYDYEVPLERVADRRYVMRLDRGPTASFKDFAARMMARWMSVLMEREQGELVILTATSGDTGSAVAHAYYGVPRVHVVVLFPTDEVSDRQRKQMTTLSAREGSNVLTIGLKGKFDDAQALVKRAFADPELSAIRLTSANSINIGRLLPQSVYYLWAWLNLADTDAREPMVASVPSGNFGDMMGGVLAQKMGLPLERMVIATNSNDEVPRFLETGVYEPIVPSRVCISNAMNVGHPSNLARLVDLYGGRMDELGVLHEPADMEAMRRDLFAVSVSEDETRATIRQAWAEHGVLLEPHGAVGWAGLLRYLDGKGGGQEPLCVSLETAHPAKFPDEVAAITGVDPVVPPALQGLEELPEEYPVMELDYDDFKARLLSRFA